MLDVIYLCGMALGLLLLVQLRIDLDEVRRLLEVDEEELL